ncbi:MAG: META domain-containing protein [Aquificales bacterium]|nr:META domain-containing protein [Aquificales bacterium]
MNILNEKRASSLLMLLLLVVGLVLVGCSSESAEPKSAEPTDPYVVTDIVWEWETLKVATGTVDEYGRAMREATTIPNPENYILILREDGTFSGTADCNQISGAYTADGGYSFTLGPSTMAACGPDSLDQQFLELLGSVVAGGPDGGGGFALETAAGGERMEFRNGGLAPAQ